MRRITRGEVQRLIEGDELIKMWVKGLAKGSKFLYGRTMLRYINFTGLSPQRLIELKKGDDKGDNLAEKRLDEYIVAVDIPESQKKIDASAIHSFYKANYADLASRSGFSKIRYVKVKEYRCPTQEELRTLTKNSRIRDDALINVLSSGGFREATAASLTWGDFKEFWSWDGQTPVYVKVESKRLKGEGYGGVEQHTFMTSHACKILLKYAEWYKSKRELNDDDPLFISESATAQGPAFTELTPQSLTLALKRMGPYSCHDLRRFQQTQLEAARVNPNWIKKMQGKKLHGEDNPYSRPKIEQMREAFASADPYLTLAEPQTIDKKEQRIEDLINSAIAWGFPLERAQHIRTLFKQRGFTLEEAAEEIRKEKQKYEPQHRVIDEDKLPNHLSHGWKFVACLSGGKCVVERVVGTLTV